MKWIDENFYNIHRSSQSNLVSISFESKFQISTNVWANAIANLFGDLMPTS